MSSKVIVFTSGTLLLISAGLYCHYPSRYRRASDALLQLASAAQPPDCRYGLEPGGGPMRCADPNNPNSYLYKKAHPQKKAVKPDASAATANKKYSIENPPKDDPKWCYAHAKGATELDRCWRHQHGEPMPEDIRPGPPPKSSKPSTRRTPTPTIDGTCPGGMMKRGGWCY